MALLSQILAQSKALGADLRDSQFRDAFAIYFMTLRPRPPTRVVLITHDQKMLQFDVTKSTQHNFPSKVTSFPVEDKVDVTDHIVNLNPDFSVSAIYSDAAEGLLFTTDRYTQREFYKLLLKARDDRQLVSLLTPLDTYTDLAITNISMPREADAGRALVVDITFEKIRKVSSELTTVFVKSRSSGTTGGNTDPKNAAGDTKTDLATPAEQGEVTPQATDSNYNTGGVGVVRKTAENAANAAGNLLRVIQ
jgi:hypothetical protein